VGQRHDETLLIVTTRISLHHVGGHLDDCGVRIRFVMVAGALMQAMQETPNK
jgi:hypothetical protein